MPVGADVESYILSLTNVKSADLKHSDSVSKIAVFLHVVTFIIGVTNSYIHRMLTNVNRLKHCITFKSASERTL